MAALLLFGLGVQKAESDDSILFPYFSSGGRDLTFIQVINDSSVTPSSGVGTLWYVYVYNTDVEACQHYDDKGTTTNKDILLYEVTNSAGIAGQLLPGDTTSTSPVLTVKPAWGFLIVTQDAPTTSTFPDDTEGTLWGQAYVANINSGTIYAYNAINDPDENTIDGGLGAFYQNAADEHNLSFLPETYASTVWYFFPVNGSPLFESGNQFLDTWITIGDDEGGVYNNNESLKSGTKYLPVGCWDEDPTTGVAGAHQFFFYKLQDILSGAQYNAVKGTGGWTDVYWDDYGYAYKIQSTSILGKPMSVLLYEPQSEDVTYSYTK